MARVTAESLMAPGGLLDAGSRLTQTLLTVPFQRQQFKAGLDEKALMTQREDDRISKTDKIGYLKDRISTTQQRIAELRNSLNVGNRTEAALKLKALGKSGGSGATKATLDIAERVGKKRDELYTQFYDKIKGGFLKGKTKDDIDAMVQQFEADEIADAKRLGNWTDEDERGGMMSLKGLDLDMIKADPQLQTELDAALDQQSQLFSQYRELVGQAQDVVDTRAFLERSLPGMAPKGKQKEEPNLYPPGMGNSHPDEMNPPTMATVPDGPGGSGDARQQFGNATKGLDASGILGQTADGANPLQADQLAEQQDASLPGLHSDITALTEGLQQGAAAGLPPDELSKIQAMQQQKQKVQQEAVRRHLTSQAFEGVVTPETLAATDKILATVAGSGHEMLNAELSGDVMANKVNTGADQAGIGPGIPATYQGPRITPQLLPRIRALAPPGMKTPSQVKAQQQVRSGLDARGLYPR